ncbi:SRPBCC family protein [Gaoshiqia sp. Z1-71]|uniref:SRPBCC family protein n=1 Tax=Gaoshiqia hydrogeniformans TaxID=3290090 RepID=UPI003BF86E47
MEEQHYQTSIVVDATAHEAFECINRVSRWWTENLEGSTQQLNDKFNVRFGDVHYSRQKIVELIPDQKIVWLVTDSYLSFLRDKNEWTGTKISFEIVRQGRRVQVRFTHLGLFPGIECFDACSNAWEQYIRQSLQSLISTGKGQPDPKENETKASG